ncbi:MAG: hypothetical protein SVC26_08115 [Pseudomonadota bacterium]|nr:hypothetical protein [Pseudomonadota bacterium]
MIIREVEHLDIPFKGKASICHLEDGQCLAVFAVFAGFYRDRSSVLNELSNGHIASLELPESLQPLWLEQTGYVSRTQGGIVFLNPPSADASLNPLLFIKPNQIELFEQPHDALHNNNCVASMALR